MDNMQKSRYSIAKSLKLISYILVDIIIISIAILFAFFLRVRTLSTSLFPLIVFGIFSTIIVFAALKLYRFIWKNASGEEVVTIMIAVTIESFLIQLWGRFQIGIDELDWTFLVSVWVFMLLFTILSRFSFAWIIKAFREIFNSSQAVGTSTLIIGAGYAGSWFINGIFNDIKQGRVKIRPVGIIDDDPLKHGMSLYGIKVIGGRDKIKETVEKYNIEQIVFAIPSCSPEEKKRILDICKETGCVVKSLPHTDELIKTLDRKPILYDISYDALLGRKAVDLDLKAISSYLEGKTILVTGGGGSIGSELCRTIMKFSPKQLIIFDIYENTAHDLYVELQRLYKNTFDIKLVIGSVREINRLEEVFEEFKPDIVFHAAAHKHVYLMEGSPYEAIKNNVFGTLNVAKAADKFKVERFILISTDKAVFPSNVMGATKRIAETIIKCFDAKSETKFSAVRFGNVLGSNGSVIPLFRKQIAEGGPITLTHKDVTRYFMTIPEAAQLVIQAGAFSKGGEIFILDMGTPVKIEDLARDLIRLSGLIPDIDIKIVYTGLGEAEKLHEELYENPNLLVQTPNEKVFMLKPFHIECKTVMEEIFNLTACEGMNNKQILEKIRGIIKMLKILP